MLKSAYNKIAPGDAYLSKCSFDAFTSRCKHERHVYRNAGQGFLTAESGSVVVDVIDKMKMSCPQGRFSIASDEPFEQSKLSSLISGTTKVYWSFVVSGKSNDWAVGIVGVQSVSNARYLYDEGQYGVADSEADCSNDSLHRLPMQGKFVTVQLDTVLMTATFIVDGIVEKSIKIPSSLFPVHFMICGGNESNIQFLVPNAITRISQEDLHSSAADHESRFPLFRQEASTRVWNLWNLEGYSSLQSNVEAYFLRNNEYRRLMDYCNVSDFAAGEILLALKNKYLESIPDEDGSSLPEETMINAQAGLGDDLVEEQIEEASFEDVQLASTIRLSFMAVQSLVATSEYKKALKNSFCSITHHFVDHLTEENGLKMLGIGRPCFVEKFDASISNSSLEMTANYTSARRPGSASTTPAAVSVVPKPSCSIVIQIKAISDGGIFSFGAALKGFPDSDNNGFAKNTQYSSFGMNGDCSESTFVVNGKGNRAPNEVKVPKPKENDILEMSFNFGAGIAQLYHNSQLLGEFNLIPGKDHTDYICGCTVARDMTVVLLSDGSSSVRSQKLLKYSIIDAALTEFKCLAEEKLDSLQVDSSVKVVFSNGFDRGLSDGVTPAAANDESPMKKNVDLTDTDFGSHILSFLFVIAVQSRKLSDVLDVLGKLVSGFTLQTTCYPLLLALSGKDKAAVVDGSSNADVDSSKRSASHSKPKKKFGSKVSGGNNFQLGGKKSSAMDVSIAADVVFDRFSQFTSILSSLPKFWVKSCFISPSAKIAASDLMAVVSILESLTVEYLDAFRNSEEGANEFLVHPDACDVDQKSSMLVACIRFLSMLFEYLNNQFPELQQQLSRMSKKRLFESVYVFVDSRHDSVQAPLVREEAFHFLGKHFEFVLQSPRHAFEVVMELFSNTSTDSNQENHSSGFELLCNLSDVGLIRLVHNLSTIRPLVHSSSESEPGLPIATQRMEISKSGDPKNMVTSLFLAMISCLSRLFSDQAKLISAGMSNFSEIPVTYLRFQSVVVQFSRIMLSYELCRVLGDESRIGRFMCNLFELVAPIFSAVVDTFRLLSTVGNQVNRLGTVKYLKIYQLWDLFFGSFFGTATPFLLHYCRAAVRSFPLAAASSSVQRISLAVRDLQSAIYESQLEFGGVKITVSSLNYWLESCRSLRSLLLAEVLYGNQKTSLNNNPLLWTRLDVNAAEVPSTLRFLRSCCGSRSQELVTTPSVNGSGASVDILTQVLSAHILLRSEFSGVWLSLSHSSVLVSSFVAAVCAFAWHVGCAEDVVNAASVKSAGKTATLTPTLGDIVSIVGKMFCNLYDESDRTSRSVPSTVLTPIEEVLPRARLLLDFASAAEFLLLSTNIFASDINRSVLNFVGSYVEKILFSLEFNPSSCSIANDTEVSQLTLACFTELKTVVTTQIPTQMGMLFPRNAAEMSVKHNCHVEPTFNLDLLEFTRRFHLGTVLSRSYRDLSIGWTTAHRNKLREEFFSLLSIIVESGRNLLSSNRHLTTSQSFLIVNYLYLIAQNFALDDIDQVSFIEALRWLHECSECSYPAIRVFSVMICKLLMYNCRAIYNVLQRHKSNSKIILPERSVASCLQMYHLLNSQLEGIVLHSYQKIKSKILGPNTPRICSPVPTSFDSYQITDSNHSPLNIDSNLLTSAIGIIRNSHTIDRNGKGFIINTKSVPLFHSFATWICLPDKDFDGVLLRKGAVKINPRFVPSTWGLRLSSDEMDKRRALFVVDANVEFKETDTWIPVVIVRISFDDSTANVRFVDGTLKDCNIRLLRIKSTDSDCFLQIDSVEVGAQVEVNIENKGVWQLAKIIEQKSLTPDEFEFEVNYECDDLNVMPTFTMLQVSITPETRFQLTIFNDQRSIPFTITTPDSIPTNSWTHVAYSIDPTTRMVYLFVNGKVVASNRLLALMCNPSAPLLRTSRYMESSHDRSRPELNVTEIIMSPNACHYTITFDPLSALDSKEAITFHSYFDGQKQQILGNAKYTGNQLPGLNGIKAIESTTPIQFRAFTEGSRPSNTRSWGYRIDIVSLEYDDGAPLRPQEPQINPGATLIGKPPGWLPNQYTTGCATVFGVLFIPTVLSQSDVRSLGHDTAILAGFIPEVLMAKFDPIVAETIATAEDLTTIEEQDEPDEESDNIKGKEDDDLNIQEGISESVDGFDGENGIQRTKREISFVEKDGGSLSDAIKTSDDKRKKSIFGDATALSRVLSIPQDDVHVATLDESHPRFDRKRSESFRVAVLGIEAAHSLRGQNWEAALQAPVPEEVVPDLAAEEPEQTSATSSPHHPSSPTALQKADSFWGRSKSESSKDQKHLREGSDLEVVSIVSRAKSEAVGKDKLVDFNLKSPGSSEKLLPFGEHSHKVMRQKSGESVSTGDGSRRNSKELHLDEAMGLTNLFEPPAHALDEIVFEIEEPSNSWEVTDSSSENIEILLAQVLSILRAELHSSNESSISFDVNEGIIHHALVIAVSNSHLKLVSTAISYIATCFQKTNIFPLAVESIRQLQWFGDESSLIDNPNRFIDASITILGSFLNPLSSHFVGLSYERVIEISFGFQNCVNSLLSSGDVALITNAVSSIQEACIDYLKGYQASHYFDSDLDSSFMNKLVGLLTLAGGLPRKFYDNFSESISLGDDSILLDDFVGPQASNVTMPDIKTVFPVIDPTNIGPNVTLIDERTASGGSSNAESVTLNVEFGQDPKQLKYFEVLCIEAGTSGSNCVGIGLAAKSSYQVNGKFPGWESGSYGYHGDDAKCHGNNKVTNFETYTKGDVVGCGFTDHNIYFTKNGKYLGVGFQDISENAVIPVVAFNHSSTKIRINAGQEDFMYAEANKGLKRSTPKAKKRGDRFDLTSPSILLNVQQLMASNSNFFQSILSLATENKFERQHGRRHPIESTLKKYEKTIESLHEYENNSNLRWEINFPGVKEITITFDPRSCTERNYDFVRFLKDKDEGIYWGQEKYTGSAGKSNWPVVKIPSDHCCVFFKSDGSNVDWGFKLTATGTAGGTSIIDPVQCPNSVVGRRILHYMTVNVLSNLIINAPGIASTIITASWPLMLQNLLSFSLSFGPDQFDHSLEITNTTIALDQENVVYTLWHDLARVELLTTHDKNLTLVNACSDDNFQLTRLRSLLPPREQDSTANETSIDISTAEIDVLSNLKLRRRILRKIINYDPSQVNGSWLVSFAPSGGSAAVTRFDDEIAAFAAFDAYKSTKVSALIAFGAVIVDELFSSEAAMTKCYQEWRNFRSLPEAKSDLEQALGQQFSDEKIDKHDLFATSLHSTTICKLYDFLRRALLNPSKVFGDNDQFQAMLPLLLGYLRLNPNSFDSTRSDYFKTEKLNSLWKSQSPNQTVREIILVYCLRAVRSGQVKDVTSLFRTAIAELEGSIPEIPQWKSKGDSIIMESANPLTADLVEVVDLSQMGNARKVIKYQIKMSGQLRIRAQPSSTADVAGYLGNGDVVEVLDVENDTSEFFVMVDGRGYLMKAAQGVEYVPVPVDNTPSLSVEKVVISFVNGSTLGCNESLAVYKDNVGESTRVHLFQSEISSIVLNDAPFITIYNCNRVIFVFSSKGLSESFFKVKIQRYVHTELSEERKTDAVLDISKTLVQSHLDTGLILLRALFSSWSNSVEANSLTQMLLEDKSLVLRFCSSIAIVAESLFLLSSSRQRFAVDFFFTMLSLVKCSLSYWSDDLIVWLREKILYSIVGFCRQAMSVWQEDISASHFESIFQGILSELCVYIEDVTRITEAAKQFTEQLPVPAAIESKVQDCTLPLSGQAMYFPFPVDSAVDVDSGALASLNNVFMLCGRNRLLRGTLTTSSTGPLQQKLWDVHLFTGTKMEAVSERSIRKISAAFVPSALSTGNRDTMINFFKVNRLVSTTGISIGLCSDNGFEEKAPMFTWSNSGAFKLSNAKTTCEFNAPAQFGEGDFIGIQLRMNKIICYVNFAIVCSIQLEQATTAGKVFAYPCSNYPRSLQRILPRIGDTVKRGPTWCWGNQDCCLSSESSIEPEGVVIGDNAYFYRSESDNTQLTFDGVRKAPNIALSEDAREVVVTDESDTGTVFAVSEIVGQDVNSLRYVEFTIMSIGADSRSAIGVGLADPARLPLSGRFVGWDNGGYGFHNDDGKCHGQFSKCNFRPYGVSDVVGCGFMNGNIFFTLNGQLLGNGFENVPETTLTPVVSARGVNAKIRLNGGQDPFIYHNFHWLKVRWNNNLVNEYRWSENELYDVILKRFLVNRIGNRSELHRGKLYCGLPLGTRGPGVCSIANRQQCADCVASSFVRHQSTEANIHQKLELQRNCEDFEAGSAVGISGVTEPIVGAVNATDQSAEEPISVEPTLHPTIISLTSESLLLRTVLNRIGKRMSFNNHKSRYCCYRCDQTESICQDCDGFPNPSSDAWTLSVGDCVTVQNGFNIAMCKPNQLNHGGWTTEMSNLIGKLGRIVAITEASNVRVECQSNVYTWNPLLLKKLSPDEQEMYLKKAGETDTAKSVDSSTAARAPGVYRWSAAPCTLPTCNSGHPTICILDGVPQEYALSTDIVSCSVACDLCCTANIEQDGHMYHCTVCGFDICYPCAVLKVAKIFESKHDYDSNENSYHAVSFPEADFCEVRFDPKSSTEANYDYVKFYKDETHDDAQRWGETYTGGYKGTASNFPGVSGRPSLLIPANNFDYHFHSDGSNNDWGYKMFVTPLKNMKLSRCCFQNHPMEYYRFCAPPTYVAKLGPNVSVNCDNCNKKSFPLDQGYLHCELCGTDFCFACCTSGTAGTPFAILNNAVQTSEEVSVDANEITTAQQSIALATEANGEQKSLESGDSVEISSPTQPESRPQTPAAIEDTSSANIEHPNSEVPLSNVPYSKINAPTIAVVSPAFMPRTGAANSPNAWDVTISNSELAFSNDNRSAKRPGSVSSYPAAMVNFPGPVCSLSVVLDSVPSSTSNHVTFGIAPVTLAKSGSDGVSKSTDSYGVDFDMSGAEIGVLSKSSERIREIRRIGLGDKMTCVVDCFKGTMLLTISYTNGEEEKETFIVPSLSTSTHLFAATFANDHQLTIVDTDVKTGRLNTYANPGEGDNIDFIETSLILKDHILTILDDGHQKRFHSPILSGAKTPLPECIYALAVRCRRVFEIIQKFNDVSLSSLEDIYTGKLLDIFTSKKVINTELVPRNTTTTFELPAGINNWIFEVVPRGRLVESDRVVISFSDLLLDPSRPIVKDVTVDVGIFANMHIDLTDSTGFGSIKHVMVGDEVVRGPDWHDGENDGGAGALGRVVFIENIPDGSTRVTVWVQWASSRSEPARRYCSSSLSFQEAIINQASRDSAIIGPEIAQENDINGGFNTIRLRRGYKTTISTSSVNYDTSTTMELSGNYFEAEVLSAKRGTMRLGFVQSDMKSKIENLGSDEFQCLLDITSFVIGDCFGCGIDIARNTIFFTKNGVKLHSSALPISPENLAIKKRYLHATLAISSSIDVYENLLRFNFGIQPFLFKDCSIFRSSAITKYFESIYAEVIPVKRMHNLIGGGNVTVTLQGTNTSDIANCGICFRFTPIATLTDIRNDNSFDEISNNYCQLYLLPNDTAKECSLYRSIDVTKLNIELQLLLEECSKTNQIQPLEVTWEKLDFGSVSHESELWKISQQWWKQLDGILGTSRGASFVGPQDSLPDCYVIKRYFNQLLELNTRFVDLLSYNNLFNGYNAFNGSAMQMFTKYCKSLMFDSLKRYYLDYYIADTHFVIPQDVEVSVCHRMSPIGAPIRFADTLLFKLWKSSRSVSNWQTSSTPWNLLIENLGECEYPFQYDIATKATIFSDAKLTTALGTDCLGAGTTVSALVVSGVEDVLALSDRAGYISNKSSSVCLSRKSIFTVVAKEFEVGCSEFVVAQSQKILFRINAANASQEIVQWLEFFGIVIGLGIRSCTPLDLPLHSSLWNLFTTDDDDNDLDNVQLSIFQEESSHILEAADAQSCFAAAIFVRRGLRSVIHRRLLALFTGGQLEELVRKG